MLSADQARPPQVASHYPPPTADIVNVGYSSFWKRNASCDGLSGKIEALSRQ